MLLVVYVIERVSTVVQTSVSDKDSEVNTGGKGSR